MRSWVITASVFVDAESEEDRDAIVKELQKTQGHGKMTPTGYINLGKSDLRLHTDDKKWEEC